MLKLSSGAVAHGCWFRVGSQGVDGEHAGESNATSAEDCALQCSLDPACDGFSFESNTGNKCTMKNKVKGIGVKAAKDITNGICPKGALFKQS